MSTVKENYRALVEHMRGCLTHLLSFFSMKSMTCTFSTSGIKPLKDEVFTVCLEWVSGGEKESLLLATHELNKNTVLGRLRRT